MTLFGMVNMANSAAYTHAAVASFYAHTTLQAEDQLILLDNDGSYQGSCDWPQFTLQQNPSPLGFAANVNQILRLAAKESADMVFLNNDMIFTPGWLPPLCQTDQAILIPRCNQHYQYRHGNLILQPFMDWSEYAGNAADLNAISDYHGQQFPFPQLTPALHLAFYCFRLPYALYRQVGLFDEQFGMGGGEDVDYRLRANHAGFQVAYADHPYVLHFMGKSTWRGGENASQTATRNTQYRTAFAQKWGEPLTQLFLLGQPDPSWLQESGLSTILSEQRYQALIEALAPKTMRFRRHRLIAH